MVLVCKAQVRQQLGNSSKRVPLKKLGGKAGGLECLGQTLTYTLALQRVPDIAVEVIVACEEQATTEREGY